MPRRENAQRRRPPISRRRTILVYCGGLRTEPAYFDGLRQVLRSTEVTVKVRAGGLAPDALVRVAADYRDQRPGTFDDVWVVFDVDEFDVEAAVTEASARRVTLAVSNPCFELWLLLHHHDCRSHCAGCTDVRQRLRKHMPQYDKARLDFGRFSGCVQDAIKRAQQLDPTGEDWRRNPSSGAWRLVEQIVGKT
jgi:hypothetical protein